MNEDSKLVVIIQCEDVVKRCSDNSHRLPCPFMNRMKALLVRKGFGNIVLGTHISQKAQAKRDAGIYRQWE